MGITNFVSENEAINLCGVSAKTLARFAEAGHLSVEKESDGLKLYSSEELEKVFGRPTRKLKSTLLKKEPPKPNPQITPFPSEFTQTIGAQRNSTESFESVHVNAQGESTEPFEAEDIGEEDGTAGRTIRVEPDNAVGPIEAQATEIEKESAKSTDPQSQDPLTPQLQALLEMEREETARLRSLVEKLERINEVNEKIIELREERITEVCDEREWLRERVERLEQKGERDQVLLLSETQLLKQLIQQQTLKRSPVRATLEWFGLVEPKQAELTPMVKGTVETTGQ